MPTSARRPAAAQRVGPGELLVTELDARPGIRLVGVRVGQAHRHVEVVGAGGEGALEDRHHEARVDGVEDVGDRVLTAQSGDRVGRRGVHARRDEPRVGDLGDGLLGSAGVVVGHDAKLEEGAPCRDRRHRAADASGPNDEDPHECLPPALRTRTHGRARPG